MQEEKKPKKPLIYYYIIVLAALLIFNFLFMPWAAERRVTEVGYDRFIEMTEEEDVGQVEINQEDNEIVFTDKDGSAIYKTGMVEDPDLTRRLYDSGAKFSGQIVEQMSPILSILLSWILPVVIFVQKADEKGRRAQFHDIRKRKEQCESLCQVFGRHQVF